MNYCDDNCEGDDDIFVLKNRNSLKMMGIPIYSGEKNRNCPYTIALAIVQQIAGVNEPLVFMVFIGSFCAYYRSMRRRVAIQSLRKYK